MIIPKTKNYFKEELAKNRKKPNLGRNLTKNLLRL